MNLDKSPTDRSRLVEIICGMAKKLSARQQHELINHIKIILMGDEKRDSERRAVNVSVDYSVKDKFYSDILENLSAGGAFIRTTRLFQAGHSTTLVLSLPKMDRNIKVRGEIVRQTGDGFGVRFADENKEMLSDIYNQFVHS
jgi:Tfp pilus assembly protein PilZ